MSNTNVPANGANVNPSPQDEPKPGKARKPGRPKKTKATIAKRWADMLLADIHFPWFAEANHTSGGVAIHRWNGSYLQFIGGEEGSAMAAGWLDRVAPDKAENSVSESAWKYSSKRLRTEKPMPAQDLRRNIIPCADVYLEIDHETGVITALAPDPDMGMTYATSLNAGTKVGDTHTIKQLPAKSLFRQFIEHALPDPEVCALVQEQCGLTLLPANYQIASWWVGAAGSGKSTLVELCKAMQRQVASISLTDLGKNFGLEGLVGASLVQVDEVEAEQWAEGKFKSLVSGNGLAIDRKNEKALMSYSLRAKWIITSNNKPFVRDKSDGVWRRLCVVPFTVVIPEELKIADFHTLLLEQEGAQILDWMLEGAQRLVKRGRFMTELERPEAVRSIKEESRNDCDSVRAWARLFSVGISDELKSKDQVFAEYEAWCFAAHEEPLKNRVFWKSLRTLVPGIENFNRRVNGVQSYFCNVGWTVPAPKLVASNPKDKPKPKDKEEDEAAEQPEVNDAPAPAALPNAIQLPLDADGWNAMFNKDSPFLEGPDPFYKENRA